jgi:uncharacterized protein YbbC (DUF1343 family)
MTAPEDSVNESTNGTQGSGIGRRAFVSALGAAAVGAAAGPVLASPAAAATPHTTRGKGKAVRTGVQELIASDYAVLRGQKVGIVTNPTGVLPDLTHEVDVMAASGDVDLVAVFGPEHGFRGTAQAGGSEGSYVDERTGLTVWDTYLKSGEALADIVRRSGVDTMVFDIQDAGARFYTYIWTMYDCMVAAAVTGKRFVVLDRPNPTTGRVARGPVLDRAFATFVGRREICQQHAMTVGEMALLFAAEYLPDETDQPLQVDVVKMRGWDRSQAYADTGLPWILPSPNMPTPDTALVYPGTCMFEGTNLSEGRGTTRPFELVGAPYVDERWAEALREQTTPGVMVREAYFTPTFSKHVNTACAGVQLHVTDPSTFDALRTGTAMIVAAKTIYGSAFAWRSDNWIDKLTGSTRFRTMVDAGASTDEVVAGWRDELAAFDRVRRQYLLYRGKPA